MTFTLQVRRDDLSHQSSQSDISIILPTSLLTTILCLLVYYLIKDELAAFGDKAPSSSLVQAFMDEAAQSTAASSYDLLNIWDFFSNRPSASDDDRKRAETFKDLAKRGFLINGHFLTQWICSAKYDLGYGQDLKKIESVSYPDCLAKCKAGQGEYEYCAGLSWWPGDSSAPWTAENYGSNYNVMGTCWLKVSLMAQCVIMFDKEVKLDDAY